MKVNLKPTPDGFGFIYGEGIDASGDTRRIDIMPPLPYWRGDIRLDNNGPHPTEWVLYVDGDEIARSPSRVEIEGMLNRFLSDASDARINGTGPTRVMLMMVCIILCALAAFFAFQDGNLVKSACLAIGMVGSAGTGTLWLRS
jgi:hypothetical protein